MGSRGRAPTENKTSVPPCLCGTQHLASQKTMSIETFSPLPLTTFGTWLTLLDPSDVPPGMSPDCADVEFFPGGVRTRPGLVSQFAPLAGTPNVNALKTYITTNLVQRLLVLDSSGTIYKETSPGTLGVLIAGLQPNLLFASTTHFGSRSNEHVSHLRRFTSLPTGYPGLPPWAENSGRRSAAISAGRSAVCVSQISVFRSHPGKFLGGSR